ncbi:MAG TPA: class I SAM-dependent methyltransferase [Polyangiaceae bacterium]|jgi:ubiquinone/menaquinone biosynthesis C-methylase UbiE
MTDSTHPSVATSYGNLCTEFYDLDKPEPPPDAFDFYLAEAERTHGPILEPMCGSGRFLLPLLARGFDIVGSDASSHMLSACRARAQRLGLAPALSEQRLDALSSERRFGLIFIPSGSFCLITDETVAFAALVRVRELLAPNGRFIVEIERRDRARASELSGTWGGRWVTRPDGAKIVLSWLSQYVAPTGISSAVHRYELLKEGRLLAQEFEDFELKLYEVSEFRALLTRAGFSEIQALTPYSLEPIDELSASEADDGVIFVCSRAVG